MKQGQNIVVECEKNRIRDEIDAQIRDFLKHGGKIDVLSTNPYGQRPVVGTAWHNQDEFFGLGR